MTLGRKTGGRKRTVFCDSCAINPIPVRSCNACKCKYEAMRKERPYVREMENERRRKFYRENKEWEQARKRAWKQANAERVNAKELARKDRTRYGEFASAHRAFINLRKLIKGKENGTDKKNELHGSGHGKQSVFTGEVGIRQKSGRREKSKFSGERLPRDSSNSVAQNESRRIGHKA